MNINKMICVFYSCACVTFVIIPEEKQKSIDIETICQLLDIVLGSTFHAQVDYFVDYLKVWITFYLQRSNLSGSKVFTSCKSYPSIMFLSVDTDPK